MSASKQLIFREMEKQELLDDLAYLEQRIIDLEAGIERLKAMVVSKEQAIELLQGETKDG